MNNDTGLLILLVLFVLYIFYKYNTEWQPSYYARYVSNLLQYSPREFEIFCAEYLQYKGYKNVKVTQTTQDGGKDIIAYYNKYKYVVECKRYKNTVGRPVIQKLHSAAITSNAIGMVMTTGNYSKQAREYASQCGVVLIEKEDLAKYLSQKNKSKAKLKKFAG